ncbi:MAG: ABC transporter ATP-binding protein [Treponema sp.]|nr:ABC transporter ATP-binding protein [Treponema sp.]
MTDNILEFRNICKTYPGSKKKANNNISLNLRREEILCIAGENGAGKTTLMKILGGLEKPDSGQILINGKKEEINSPRIAEKLNIGMVHQHFMLFPEYTVAENILMGTEPIKCLFFYDKKKAREITENLIKKNEFSLSPNEKIKDLSLGQMQQTEICRILHRDAQIIILDEPTSVLTEAETSSLFKTLKTFAQASGKSIILITHKLHEIKMICDRVAVMRKGELACICAADGINEYEIAEMMTGSAVSAPVKNTEVSPLKTKPVIKFDSVTVTRKRQKLPLLDNVSFSVFPKEIIGFAGVGGNGLGVIEAVLGGFLHPAQGKVLHNGKDISSLNIRRLRGEGLSYVPADRMRVGSAGEMSIEENMIINKRQEFFKYKNDTAEFVKNISEKYNMEMPDYKEKAFCLSGGNLQKLILAREIDCFKDYIVFSEPTWGLDITSGNLVRKEILKLRDNGAAVILISTNLDDILLLADRIFVMYKGKIAKEFINDGNEEIRNMTGNCMQGLGI